MRLTYRGYNDVPFLRTDAEQTEVITKLAAYEDAEEQGRLVILPCKVGDMVWSRDVEPWTVILVEWFSRKVTQLHCKSPVTGRGMTFSVGKRSLGKTVFLTREEAEAALKEGQDDAPTGPYDLLYEEGGPDA